MNVKKWFFAGLAGGLVMFLLSGLWYQVLTAKMHQEGFQAIARSQSLYPWVVASYLVLAFVMSAMYPIGYKGGAPAKEGAVFGLLVGLLVGLSTNVLYYGVWNVPLSAQLIDSAWELVEKGLGGIAIALVWGRTKKSI
jgi:hypothetical protein